MPEIWVTMRSCTECVHQHDDEDEFGPPPFGCDCRCHDGHMDEDDEP